MSIFKTDVQTLAEGSNLTAAHDLPPVDLTRKLAAATGIYVNGIILKRDGAGIYSRWVQGTDAVGLAVGVFAHHYDVDTATQTTALVRDFGPVAKVALVAATNALGTTTAAPSVAVLDALAERKIYAL